MTSWLRHHWLALLFIAALIAAPLAAHHDAVAQADNVRQANVARCIAVAPRAAYDIAFQYQAGDARRAAGNIVTAAKYDALADAQIKTVAAPAGFAGNKELVEVVYRKVPGTNKLVAQLTDRALTLQERGCREAFDE